MSDTGQVRHHDLIVIGAGSGNSVVDDRFGDLDVAIVAEGPFGGTCLNAGCIPSKILAQTAEVARQVRDADRYDVEAELREVDWSAVRKRTFDRLDKLSADGKQGRENSDFITVYDGTARFTGPRRLAVETSSGTVELEADRVVIAAGSRPAVPPVVAESGLPYETSDTVMRLDEVPRRLVILGGGYIAAELATVFAAFGSEIMIVEQAPTLLSGQDDEVCELYTKLAGERFDVRLKTELTAVAGVAGELRLTLDDGSVLVADRLLVASGRTPNGDRLQVNAAGIELTDDGRIVVDKYQQTTADGVYALGDVCTPVPLKHVANREADVVKHNLLNPNDLVTADHEVIPAAVFADPQIASVGATEQDLREAGRSYRVGKAQYADIAYGWALTDPPGFCKVLSDPATGQLLGAHIIGPQASTLIHPLVMAMALRIDVKQVASGSYWIHPALTELVENALLNLEDN